MWGIECVFSKVNRTRSPSCTRIVGPGTPQAFSPWTGSTASPSAQKAHTVVFTPGWISQCVCSTHILISRTRWAS